MKQTYFSETLLSKLDFVEGKLESLEEDGAYKVWTLKKNDCTLEITVEYNDELEKVNCYVEFNHEVLKGKCISQDDLLILIYIM